MNHKERFALMVKYVKNFYKAKGERFTQGDITIRMGWKNNAYISQLLNGFENVNENHILLFQERFKNELRGFQAPSLPDDPINRERALIKVLLHHVAKIEAKIYEQDIDECLKELEQDTKLEMNNLGKQ